MGSAAISTPTHVPVLLKEAVDALQPRPGGRYVDGTFGGGGHTRRLLEASIPDGTVLAIDLDPEAIERAARLRNEEGYEDHLIVEHGSFADLAALAARHDLVPLDGILLDLGVSSFQLDMPDRGFSFAADGPLDMRFDTTSGQPASDLVNRLDEAVLADIIWRYGDEPKSRRIARAIVDRRKSYPFETTHQLASVIELAVGGRRGARIHPATPL